MKILFFAPHSAVWIQAFPEALVAEALAQEGNEIIYVGCGRLLNDHCIAMMARGVPFSATTAQKERVCRECVRNKGIIRKRLALGGMDLSERVEAEDFAVADRLVSEATPESFMDLVIDNVEVGRIALYELLIQHKKTDVKLTPGEWQRYRASLRNSIIVLRVMRRVLAAVQPDRVVLYNALYSTNRVVCRLAELQGVPQYFLHSGDNLSKRLQTLIVARDHAFAYYARLREKWGVLQDRPTSREGLRSATDHFLEVVRGRSPWAYSAAVGKAEDLRSKFSIGPGRKIICATMSSDDERFSGETVGTLPPAVSAVFPRQVDWIKSLIRHVEGRQDLSLIVRVHPREFPNKRERVLSEHAKMLQGALADVPDNVKVNWPTDAVSLYDLANVVDVFTNAWSSAGLEMAWLGLPVVLYSHDMTLYPADLNYVGGTEQEYFEQLERALRDGWNADRIRLTYRWCAIQYRYGALDISESFSRVEDHSFFARARRRTLRELLPNREQRADCRRRARRLNASARINEILKGEMGTALDVAPQEDAITFSQETVALKEEVARLVAELYGNAESPQQDSLASKLRQFARS